MPFRLRQFPAPNWRTRRWWVTTHEAGEDSDAAARGDCFNTSELADDLEVHEARLASASCRPTAGRLEGSGTAGWKPARRGDVA